MSRPSLDTLENRDEFVRRHIGPSDADIETMLEVIGIDSLDALVDKAVPDGIRTNEAFDVPAMTETDALAELAHMAALNTPMSSLIGLGYHDTVTPSVILRNLIENPGWYTAYTPYQAEISQGRLEALLNFQQVIVDLTGMPMANASLLDEATAVAEAMTLMKRMGKSKNDTIFMADDCLPQTIAVVETRATPLGFTVQVGNPTTDLACRWALAARTRRSWRRVKNTNAQCQAVSSGCLRTLKAARHCVWRYKRANNISAAKKRRPTSARRKYCWPTLPACIAFITARTA